MTILLKCFFVWIWLCNIKYSVQWLWRPYMLQKFNWHYNTAYNIISITGWGFNTWIGHHDNSYFLLTCNIIGAHGLSQIVVYECLHNILISNTTCHQQCWTVVLIIVLIMGLLSTTPARTNTHGTNYKHKLTLAHSVC